MTESLAVAGVTIYGPSPDYKQDFLMEEAVCFYVHGF